MVTARRPVIQAAIPSHSEVINDLQCASTTTPQSLQTLRAILDIQLQEPSLKAPPRRNHSKPLAEGQNLTCTRKVQENAKASIETRKAKLQHGNVAHIAPLQGKSRAKFATEVFNVALKSLSDSVKLQLSESLDNNLQKPTLKQKPPPEAVQATIAAQTRGECEALNMDILAQCAQIALKCLRQEADRENGDSDENFFKREQGAIVLLDKLIALDLHNLALEESRNVFEQYWKTRSEPLPTPKKRFTISDMLLMPASVSDATTYKFAASFQSQMLRLSIHIGNSSINNHFIESLAMNTSGSPYDTTIQALNRGFLSVKAASQQLRTLSNALMKLAGSRHNSSTKNQCLLSLRVTFEAMCIRLESWNLLGHKPDMGTEVWAVISRVLRLVFGAYPATDEPDFLLLKELIACLQNKLKDVNLDQNLTEDIQNFYVDSAEAAGYIQDALQILREGNLNGHDTEYLKAVRIAALLVSSGARDSAALAQIRRASDMISDINTKSPKEISKCLTELIRLRKACLSLISIAEPKARDGTIDDALLESQQITLKIIFKSFEVSKSLQPDATASVLAKFMDAILQAEKCNVTRQGDLQVQCNSALQSCVAVLKDLLDGFTDVDDKFTEVVHSLCVRMSNALYFRHTRALELKHDATMSLRLLELSIQAMEKCRLVDRQQAAIGTKLERLAKAYQSAGNVSRALEAYEQTIDHYIETGALSDAAETSLKMPFEKVWTDAGTVAAQLGRVLQARLRLEHEQSTVQWRCVKVYDREELISYQRFTLLEFQARLLIGFSCRQVCCQGNIVIYQNILQFIPEDKYRFCRMRFISHLLQISAKQLGSLVNNLLDSSETSKLCMPVGEKENVYLKPFGDILTKLFVLQCIMLESPKDLTPIKRHVLSFCQALQQLSSKQEIEAHIDDPNTVLCVLEAVSDLFRVTTEIGLGIMCLDTKIQILRTRGVSAEEMLTEALLQLADRQLFLGEHKPAWESIQEARTYLDTTPSLPVITKLNYFLLLAEYLYNEECYEDSQTTLTSSVAQYDLVLSTRTSSSSRSRIEIDSLVCHASLLSSRLAFRSGNLLTATELARKAVKISTSIWVNVESMKSTSVCKIEDAKAAEMSHKVFASKSSPEIPSPTVSKGPLFWKQLELHLSALSHMAMVSAHLGLYSDATYYYNSAEKIALASRSQSHLALVTSSLALLHAKAGRLSESLQLLDTVQIPDKMDAQWMFSSCVLNRAEAYVQLKDIESAQSWLKRLQESRLPGNSTPPINKSESTQIRKKKQNTDIKTSSRLKSHKNHSQTKKQSNSVSVSVPKQTYIEREIQDRHDALVMLLKEATDGKLQHISDITSNGSVDGGKSSLVQRAYAQIFIFLSQAMQDLSSNSITSVLAETAMALPVRYKKTGKGGRVSLMQAHLHSKAGFQSTGTKTSASSPVTVGQELFLRVHDMIRDLAERRTEFCASDMIHVLHRLLSQVILFSSAVHMPFTYTSAQLVLQASVPKDIASAREQAVVLAERATKEASDVRKWPVPVGLATLNRSITETYQDFDLEMLPEDWSIFSISLSDDRKELFVTKIIGGRTPFLLRIPLTRSDDVDEQDEFNFTEASSTIEAIIEQANQLAHDTRGSSDKESRTAWHAERQCLEEQLEAWLANVDSLWLGGFRGLFTPYYFDEATVKNFRQAVSTMIDKHLPSRRRQNSGKMDKVELHTHVLEMFLGLGSPEENELDDAVEDLLYFVVDIVQFSGESNAYDEIDWDEMLMDVLSAMNESHHKGSIQRTQHTILILDKELQSFPWESLPCLRGQPVSRMPSLGSIFERMDRVERPNYGTSGCRIPNQHNGFYILNPSKDLISTQELFEPALQTSLPTYGSLVGKVPSEDKFASMLTSNDIVLYFGHGSAGQYIRGRTIRALDKCAVTLLMGCSSAKMTECGKFESFGMPSYYMLGGSTAVVGNLWDVTDRDIDRFALTTMIEWGLLDKREDHVQDALSKSMKKKKMVKGKEQSVQKSSVGKKGEQGGSLSLVEAVMKGRDACVLPYLNGAAPVVYGLPVYLN